VTPSYVFMLPFRTAFTLAARDFRFKLQLPGRIEVHQDLMTVRVTSPPRIKARHRPFFNFALDLPVFNGPCAVGPDRKPGADQRSASPSIR